MMFVILARNSMCFYAFCCEVFSEQLTVADRRGRVGLVEETLGLLLGCVGGAIGLDLVELTEGFIFLRGWHGSDQGLDADNFVLRLGIAGFEGLAGEHGTVLSEE